MELPDLILHPEKLWMQKGFSPDTACLQGAQKFKTFNLNNSYNNREIQIHYGWMNTVFFCEAL